MHKKIQSERNLLEEMPMRGEREEAGGGGKTSQSLTKV